MNRWRASIGPTVVLVGWWAQAVVPARAQGDTRGGADPVSPRTRARGRLPQSWANSSRPSPDLTRGAPRIRFERAPGAPTASSAEEAPVPSHDDRDRDRILHLQAALRDIVQSGFGHRKVGLRVIEVNSGRVFFGRGTTALMDPASNQKVLATTAALVRLGGQFRFHTEVFGPPPGPDGVVRGDLRLRGSGDPTLGVHELEELASKLAARGVTRVTGGVVADPRRLGDDDAAPRPGESTVPGSANLSALARGGRPPAEARLHSQPQLVVDRGTIAVRVRPAEIGEAPRVVLDPSWGGAARESLGDLGEPDFLLWNHARTREGRQRRLVVDVDELRGGELRVEVGGRIGAGSPGVLYRPRVPNTALAAGMLFRATLAAAGIRVAGRVTVGVLAQGTGAEAGTSGGETAVQRLVGHESEPLSLLLRKINKDSDNYEAERLLEIVGAEVQGGEPTTEKGILVVRDVIGGFGLDPRSYVPKNGSGLGHENRISAGAMTELLRALYLDPRVGPELMQSLSVGGVDGTTRNRFRGTPVARHVRAKTGTLSGKSCLSGLVGDGADVMAFSIMVQGFKTRAALTAVRGAQVAAVNVMMRYVQERTGVAVPALVSLDDDDAEDDGAAGGTTDFETGGVLEVEDEVGDPRPAPHIAGPPLGERQGRIVLAGGAAMVPRGRAAPEPGAGGNESGGGRGGESLDAVVGNHGDLPVVPDLAQGSEMDRSWATRVGLGGAGTWPIAGGDVAPGARAFVDVGGPTIFGVEASVYGTTFHDRAGPGGGSTEWTRFGGVVGPRARIPGRSLGLPSARDLALDVHGGVAVGWFWVRGHNYTTDASSRSWALGAALGTRLTWPIRDDSAIEPWVGVDAVAWPGRHAIEIVGVPETQSLPSLDLLLSLGASWRSPSR